MDDLKKLAMESKADYVKVKILQLIQCWANAFRENQDYKMIVDTYDMMKLEGDKFYFNSSNKRVGKKQFYHDLFSTYCSLSDFVLF